MCIYFIKNSIYFPHFFSFKRGGRMYKTKGREGEKRKKIKEKYLGASYLARSEQ